MIQAWLVKWGLKIGILIIILIILIGGFFSIKNLISERDRFESNYNAQIYATQFWKTKNGTSVARAATLVLTANEIKNSKDKDIQELVATQKDLKIKNRKLEQMLLIKADTIIVDTSKIDTIRDTKNVLVYQDSLNIGDLHILRQQEVGTMVSKYIARYNPTLYIYVSWSKEEPWRLRNLFVYRKKTYFVDIVSKDKLLNVIGVKAIVKK